MARRTTKDEKLRGVKTCSICGQVKSSDQFDADGRQCYPCLNVKYTGQYKQKMENVWFQRAEQARRMEKYYRRKKENFLKKYYESIAIK